MKVRKLAVFTILALAAWLPLQAQQSQAPATPQDTSKEAKHECCCAAKGDSPQSAAAHEHSAMNCCHDQKEGQAKASCCDGKDAKEMACCSKKDEAAKSAMNCCKDRKDGQCSKDGKSCCQNMATKDAKDCCTGMGNHCPARAGK